MFRTANQAPNENRTLQIDAFTVFRYLTSQDAQSDKAKRSNYYKMTLERENGAKILKYTLALVAAQILVREYDDYLSSPNKELAANQQNEDALSERSDEKQDKPLDANLKMLRKLKKELQLVSMYDGQLNEPKPTEKRRRV